MTEIKLAPIKLSLAIRKLLLNDMSKLLYSGRT
jgi:hypothetical protein